MQPIPKARTYPAGIKVSDTKYPMFPKSLERGTQEAEAWYDRNRTVETLSFYRTERFGWVIQTLHIRNASRRQRNAGMDTSRSYAISMDGTMCRVGLGPHVAEKFMLYVTKERLAALQKYLDLYNKGMGAANEIRDVRSTRMMRRDRSYFL
jgi:hypothetical protein